LKPPAAGIPAVYGCIAEVQGELAKVGIAKERRNQQGSGYNFRGIDDVYAALAPLLAKHGLTIIPRLTDRWQEERTSKNGGTLFYTTVKADFDFVAVADGSVHTASTYGEAMDSGDKSTNKAMSAAYKYAAFMTFAIPTEGNNDADETTHEIASGGMPDAEFACLVGMIEATGTATSEMVKYFGVPSLRDLNQQQYAEAIDILEKKKKLAKRAKTDAKAKGNLAKEIGDEIKF
jgi:hypothetical protein